MAISHASRQPVFYLTHGGGPCFWIDSSGFFGKGAYDELRFYFEGLLQSLPEKPRAILIVTAHWEEDVFTLSTASNPPMLYDYYGFPEHTYALQYPAPGAPDVADRALKLLKNAGIETNVNSMRGFDHGVFVPMLIIDKKAEIPVVMMSIRHDYNPQAHIAMGEALQLLREEGVLIIASGSSYHNLRVMLSSVNPNQASVDFDNWLNDSVSRDEHERKQRLIAWENAPHARECHPQEDHLIPLMVAVGAAGNERGRRTFSGVIGGKSFSCFGFGV